MSVAPTAASANVNVTLAEAGPSYSTVSIGITSQDSWEETLYWYLMWIHQHIGGDPTQLQYIQTVQCMVIISDFYNKTGMPTSQSDQERRDFRAVIGTVNDLLNNPPPGYPPDAIMNFKVTLDLMNRAVGGTPGMLP